jgi:hypothetical protein
MSFQIITYDPFDDANFERNNCVWAFS